MTQTTHDPHQLSGMELHQRELVNALRANPDQGTRAQLMITIGQLGKALQESDTEFDWVRGQLYTQAEKQARAQ
jgi:hypothetical protein